MRLTLSLKAVTHPAFKVHLCIEGDQRLNAFHLSDAVVALLNQLNKLNKKRRQSPKHQHTSYLIVKQLA